MQAQNAFFGPTEPSDIIELEATSAASRILDFVTASQVFIIVQNSSGA